MRETIPVTSEEQWLDLRREDITSTMIPALYGLSPYTTRFEIYHAKASGIELPFASNERVEKGARMEAYAAQEVALRTGWKVEPFKDYMRIPGARAGCSFDCIATKPDGSRGILEIKAVDFFRHRDLWVEDQAPEHIEIQLQFQLEVADEFDWGAIAAFTGIYDFTLYERARDLEMGSAMRATVNAFWEDVDARRAPDPDFARDEDVIAALFRQTRDQPLDMTGSDTFDELLARFDRWKLTEKEAKACADAAKAEIHFRLADAGAAFTERYKVTAGWTKDTPGKPITADMVGTITGARAGYRQCLVKDLTIARGAKI